MSFQVRVSRPGVEAHPEGGIGTPRNAGEIRRSGPGEARGTVTAVQAWSDRAGYGGVRYAGKEHRTGRATVSFNLPLESLAELDAEYGRILPDAGIRYRDVAVDVDIDTAVGSAG